MIPVAGYALFVLFTGIIAIWARHRWPARKPEAIRAQHLLHAQRSALYHRQQAEIHEALANAYDKQVERLEDESTTIRTDSETPIVKVTP